MTDHKLLQEQLQYYSARAREYDESVQQVSDSADEGEQPESREWAQAVEALRALGRQGRVLELAGGTGLWTRELTKISSELTVLDGAQEMLDVNRAKIDDLHVRYECVDLFEWNPTEKYDLVFFGFWLSHVPRELLSRFLDRVSQATTPGGHALIVDEPAGGRQLTGPARDGMYQTRTVEDGRTFNIVKVYYEPHEIQELLRQRGFVTTNMHVGEYFFHLICKRQNEAP
jgi:demethylmenaquinone methyltransferase/2-methoxy-6-polyprenyl-1,4-benzoquinol methylase